MAAEGRGSNLFPGVQTDWGTIVSIGTSCQACAFPMVEPRVNFRILGAACPTGKAQEGADHQKRYRNPAAMPWVRKGASISLMAIPAGSTSIAMFPGSVPTRPRSK